MVVPMLENMHVHEHPALMLLLVLAQLGCVPQASHSLSDKQVSTSPTLAILRVVPEGPSETFQERLIVHTREPKPGMQRIHRIAPTATGDLWLGGFENLLGRLTPQGFLPFRHHAPNHASSSTGQVCRTTTVTQSILVHRDNDVYFASHEYCAGPDSQEFSGNLLEHFDGQSMQPLGSQIQSSDRLDIELHQTGTNKIYATAPVASEGETGSSTLYELTASEWKPLLRLDAEGIALPIEDSQATLWLTAIKYSKEIERPTSILRREGTQWLRETAPAFGNLLLATDGTLFFLGLHGIWERNGSEWMSRPIPIATSIIQVLAHSRQDIYFLVYPPAVLHYDGKGFRSIAIENADDRDPPIDMRWNGKNHWLASSRRVWKLSANSKPDSVRIVDLTTPSNTTN